jgi:threonine/homoserine/homoserine lactone efflux protein
MRWNAGVLAGLLIGLVWLVVGLVLVVVGRRRRRLSQADGAGNMAVIGVFLLAVGALTWFATLLLAVVPG